MSDNTTSHKASEYDTGILMTIPFYNEFHRQAIDMMKQRESVNTLLDVGCGTGIFEALLLEEFPDVRITAIDPSMQMLEEAKKRCISDQIEYLCQISENIDYDNYFDVVTAIQVHHYLPEEKREQATRNVYRALKQGGIYISFENVIPEDEELLEPELERWKRYQIASGKSVDEAEEHVKRCGVNYFPITVEQHIKLLRRTGFRLVYVFWKSYMQMGIGGIK